MVSPATEKRLQLMVEISDTYFLIQKDQGQEAADIYVRGLGLRAQQWLDHQQNEKDERQLELIEG